MAWLGLYGFAWNDYDTEARPAVDALVHGHLLEFLRLSPAYGGSLIERAPFALAPTLWGGGELAVYRALALPCLVAAVGLGLWLVTRMRAAGSSRLGRGVTLAVCVANPLTLRALELGHPEELLGACLCVATVLLASRDRPLAAALALGLAIANKEWALLAVGPTVLSLPPGRRLRFLALCGVVVAAILAPLLLVSSGGFASGTRAIATASSPIFQPWQVWWFLGHHGALVHGLFGAAKPGYRTGPAWTGELSHPLILLVGAVAAIAAWLRMRHLDGARAVLGEPGGALLLALVLLARCVLDTWDVVYYFLPFVLALLAWETLSHPRRPPALALTSSVLAWISFVWLPDRVSPDTQAVLFLAWSLPLACMLALRLYAPPRWTASGGGRTRKRVPKPGLFERDELLGKASEPLGAVLADQRQVLDAHT